MLMLIGCRVTYVAYKDIIGYMVFMRSITLFVLLRYKEVRKYFWLLQMTLMILGFEIISYYLSRCALIGAVVFVILIMIPKKFWINRVGRVFYGIVSIGLTLGTVFFSFLLTWIAQMRETLNFKFFIKIFSRVEKRCGQNFGACF